MEETWKEFTYLNKQLSVSSLGKIKINNELLQQSKNNGYLSVRINKKSVLAHRIVAIAFHENPLGKKCVNHINGKKIDNMAENLDTLAQSKTLNMPGEPTYMITWYFLILIQAFTTLH
jgi:hypothetical protein